MSLKLTVNRSNQLGLYNLDVEGIFKSDSKFCEDNSVFKYLENESSSDEYTDFTVFNVKTEYILKTIKDILDEGKWSDLEKETDEILENYAIRKSKFITYKPTDEEMKNAILMHKNMLKDAEKHDEYAILKSTSEDPDVQIKLLGALFEASNEFPDGVSMDDLMNISEKWGVLDYMTKELLNLENFNE